MYICTKLGLIKLEVILSGVKQNVKLLVRGLCARESEPYRIVMVCATFEGSNTHRWAFPRALVPSSAELVFGF